MEDITPFLPGDAVAFLRIADGDRRFPFRPVCAGLFLIGQGPSCDLRLGLPGIPSIHSIIRLSDESAEITRIAEHPELLINGEVVARSPLHHGDMVEIGDVRLAFYLCHPADAASPQQVADAEFPAPHEIIAKLESEIALIGSTDSSQERVQELLKAAQLAVETAQCTQTLRFADYTAENVDSVNSSDDTMRQLLLAKLNSQEHRLDEICHVLEQVVQQQQLIAASLQSVMNRLDDLRTVSQTGPLRASA